MVCLFVVCSEGGRSRDRRGSSWALRVGGSLVVAVSLLAGAPAVVGPVGAATAARAAVPAASDVLDVPGTPLPSPDPSVAPADDIAGLPDRLAELPEGESHAFLARGSSRRKISSRSEAEFHRARPPRHRAGERPGAAEERSCLQTLRLGASGFRPSARDGTYMTVSRDAPSLKETIVDSSCWIEPEIRGRASNGTPRYSSMGGHGEAAVSQDRRKAGRLRDTTSES